MDSMIRYLDEVRHTLSMLPLDRVRHAADELLCAHARGSTVFTLGNGGSAATASHFSCDLAKGTISPARPRFRVIALTDSVPQMTAWSNDVAYEEVFAELLRGLMRQDDVIVAFSGSGNSANVLRAVELARSKGGTSIGFTGFAGGRLKGLVDIPVVVPCDSLKQIEDVHLILCHLITSLIREELERPEPAASLRLETPARQWEGQLAGAAPRLRHEATDAAL